MVLNQTIKLQFTYLLFVALSIISTPIFSNENDLFEKYKEYLEFASENQGVIYPSQLDQIDENDYLLIDVRYKKRFDERHIKNAKHYYWKEIFNHFDKLPKNKTIILYCDTGVFSSRAQFMLEQLGLKEVKVLWGGFFANIFIYTNLASDLYNVKIQI